MPRSLPTATPPKARGKSKGNRSVRCIPGGNEVIWDEELHAALIEALNIYPPMGRQRIRPAHEGGETNNSLGRCQLIQRYLMEKTGKNRTRKQISSRIQRLRRTHQDDPSVADALLVLPEFQYPIAPEMLINFTDGATSPTSTTPFLLVTDPASFESSASSSPSVKHGDSFHSSASSSSLQTNQQSLRLLDSADLRHLSVSSDTDGDVSARRSDQENTWPGPAIDLPDRTARALSRRRMTSTLTELRLQLDLPSGPSSLFSESGYGFETASLTLSGIEPPSLSYYGQTSDPITPLDQIIHTPEFPPQVARYDRRSSYQQLRCSERESVFQPGACYPSLVQYDTHPASYLFPSTAHNSVKPSPFNTCRAQNYSFPFSPLASFQPTFEPSPQPLLLGPESCCGSIQTTQDVAHVAHLPRRLSYSCDLGLPPQTTSVPYSCASQEGNMAITLGGLDLAPPAVIRPFFVSEYSCLASNRPPHPPLAELATASLHDETVSQ